MHLSLSRSNKVLIGVAMLLYIIGHFIGALGIVLHLVILSWVTKVIIKSKKSGELATIDLAVLIGFLLLFNLVRVGIVWNYYNDQQIKSDYKKRIEQNSKPTPSIIPTPSLIPRKIQSIPLKEIESPYLSGSIKKIDLDLGLILDESQRGVNYYEAGKFIKGKYAGYTRIIGVQALPMSAEPYSRIFATSDYKTFILASEPPQFGTLQNTLDGMNKSKVITVDEMESDFPDIITLDGTFGLYKQSIKFTVDERAPKADWDKYVVQSSFPTLKRLPSFSSFLALFAFHYDMQPEPTNGGNPAFKNPNDTTQVIVQDSTGLAYSYSLARLVNLNENSNILNGILESPNKLFKLFLTIKKEEILTTLPTYGIYDVAFPVNCVRAASTYIANDMSQNQLSLLGKTSDNIELFILKDSKNIRLQEQLDTKPGNNNVTDGTKEIWSIAEGKTVRYPTLEEYTAKNPLLFFKDPWGRWVMLGEFDYPLQGGCGKPVVYLYPEKQQKVTVSFLRPMQFETVIPSYGGNWTVLASPNGTLKDLQPKLTDCSLIDSSKPGSEYAKKACEENKYPYLYWAGNTIGTPYPQSINNGWYVEKSNLKSFMIGKLTEIGLNSQEQNDMLEYWVPQMISKNTPFYKISFLTTKQMNELIPMNIQPQPSSILRVFLDFVPLSEKPDKLIMPQQFTPFIRNGFTVVEWGGIKR